MARTVSIYRASIGQKIVSALTGVFLCAFLVVHLSGNILLYKGDGGKAFDQYASRNATSILMRSLELVLFAGFAIHIFWGTRFWLGNRKARPRGYQDNRPSESSPLFARAMFLTGGTVLLFLAIHLASFWAPMRFRGRSGFEVVRMAFRNPWYDLFYIACLVFVSCHLRQGFQSACQTFGLRPAWRKAVDIIALGFWLLIPAGFASMPVYFFFSRGNP